jgi:hypothetical protein
MTRNIKMFTLPLYILIYIFISQSFCECTGRIFILRQHFFIMQTFSQENRQMESR